MNLSERSGDKELFSEERNSKENILFYGERSSKENTYIDFM